MCELLKKNLRCAEEFMKKTVFNNVLLLGYYWSSNMNGFCAACFSLFVFTSIL
jgi:hypothetical protein